MRYALLLVPIISLGCGQSTPTGPTTIGVSGGTASLRVVNTTTDSTPLDVLVGGRAVITDLPSGQVSAVVPVSPGTRQIAFRPFGGTAGPATSVPLPINDTTTLLMVASPDVISPWILSDTGAVVPTGSSKLRVVNFASQAPSLLAWRRQPNFPVFVTFQFPFPYQTATPYVQSDPGDWIVLVSTEAYDGGAPVVTDTLARSDPIAVGSGESRTVVLMDDGSGGVAMVVMQP